MSEQELHEVRKRFEEKQLSRRAALRKLGITAGAAFFSMFMLDDLARMAASRLDQYHGDSKLADDLAREFHNAGVAFATASACQHCVDAKVTCINDAVQAYETCIADGIGVTLCQAAENSYEAGCRDSYNNCCAQNNCNCA